MHMILNSSGPPVRSGHRAAPWRTRLLSRHGHAGSLLKSPLCRRNPMLHNQPTNSHLQQSSDESGKSEQQVYGGAGLAVAAGRLPAA